MTTRRPTRHALSRTRDLTYEEALSEIRRWKAQYPDVPPEVTAIWLLRQIDSWDEHRAVLKALDEVLDQES